MSRFLANPKHTKESGFLPIVILGALGLASIVGVGFLGNVTDCSPSDLVCWGYAIASGLVRVSFGTLAAAAELIYGATASGLQWVIKEMLSIPVAPGAPGINTVVQTGWDISRTIVNSLFLLILVFIGLSTILRFREIGNQRTLISLVAVALLVNFSGVLVGFVVDIANILTSFFFNVVKDIEWAVYWPGASNVTGGDLAEVVALSIAMILYYIVATLIYVAVVAILFLRTFVLWTLAILAPFAFAAYILPNTRAFWNRWLQTLVHWAFIGVPIGFFLYLAGLVLEQSAQKAFNPLEGGGTTPGALSSFLAPFTALFLLFVGLGFSALGGWSRRLTQFAGGAAMIGAAVLLRDVVRKRLAENERTRGAMQRTSVSANPTWGKNQTGFFAGLKRGAAGATGWTKRGVGKAAVGTVITPEEKRADQARSKAMGQDVFQNLGDLRNPRKSPAEQRKILDAMIAQKQLRDATNIDVVGKDNVLKIDEVEKAYRNAHMARDRDVEDALKRAFVKDKEGLAGFARIEDEMTRNADNQYEDRTTDGLTQEDRDKGITSFKEKIMAAATSADDIGQLQRGWWRDEELTEAAHEFWGGTQVSQAANHFGREFLNAFEQAKKDADFYFTPVQRGMNSEGKPIYQTRNAGLARWEAGNAGQNLGVAPKEGAEGTGLVNAQANLANAWAGQYGDLQSQYSKLRSMIRDRGQVQRLEAMEAPQEDIELVRNTIKEKWGDLQQELLGSSDKEIRDVWLKTQEILGDTPENYIRGGIRAERRRGGGSGGQQGGGGTPRRPRGPGGRGPVSGGSGDDIPEGWEERNSGLVTPSSSRNNRRPRREPRRNQKAQSTESLDWLRDGVNGMNENQRLPDVTPELFDYLEKEGGINLEEASKMSHEELWQKAKEIYERSQK